MFWFPKGLRDNRDNIHRSQKGAAVIDGGLERSSRVTMASFSHTVHVQENICI